MTEQVLLEVARQSPAALVLLWAVISLTRRMDALNTTLTTTLDRLAVAALRAPDR